MVSSNAGTEYLKIRTIFDFFDRDGTNKLDLSDLTHLMNCAGEENQADVLVMLFNPPVNFEQFNIAMKRIDDTALQTILRSVEFYLQGKLQDAFEYFDGDNDGYLQHEDLGKLNAAVGERMNLTIFD